MVQSWYQGGISVMDFTDPEHPVEIAYFDRGPVDAKVLADGGSWSAYWYNGRIYSSEIARGLDILELTPTENLSQNEIDAAKTVQVSELNVQNQQKLVWPRKLVVAKAYLDQLERSGGLSSEQIGSLREAIKKAESSSSELKKLKGFASSVEKNARQAKNSADSARLTALAEILKRPEV
jgi:ribosomal protein S13